jgi:hypothetical protein
MHGTLRNVFGLYNHLWLLQTRVLFEWNDLPCLPNRVLNLLELIGLHVLHFWILLVQQRLCQFLPIWNICQRFNLRRVYISMRHMFWLWNNMRVMCQRQLFVRHNLLLELSDWYHCERFQLRRVHITLQHLLWFRHDLHGLRQWQLFEWQHLRHILSRGYLCQW